MAQSQSRLGRQHKGLAKVVRMLAQERTSSQQRLGASRCSRRRRGNQPEAQGRSAARQNTFGLHPAVLGKLEQDAQAAADAAHGGPLWARP